MGQTRPYRLASAAFLSTTEIFALWSFPNPHNPETGSLLFNSRAIAYFKVRIEFNIAMTNDETIRFFTVWKLL